MVRFESTIEKMSRLYKTITNAITSFKQQEPDENYYIFGTVVVDKQEFIGILVNKKDGQELSDLLDKALEVKVPQAPPTPVMTAKAGGFPYGEFIKAGWTNEQLLEHGYIEDDIQW